MGLLVIYNNLRLLIEIIFNRYDSTGKDFEPLAGSIRGSHIKLTAVGNAADTNYGLYEVLTNPTISGSTITVSVRHLASSGTLPNDEISISVLSSTATGTGVSVTDGEDPPVANATNHEGDLYIQIQEHETEVGQHQVNIWLYKNGVWVNEANLTGRQGEMGIQGFQGIGINTISGSTPVVGEEVTVTVTLNDPKGDPTTNQTFTVPAGAKGNPGDNIDPALLDFENDSSDVNQINVTYNSIPIGNFDVQEGIDGRSIVGIVRTTGDGSPGTTDTYTITYDKGTPLTQTFDVYNGNDGTNVTLATITNGVRVTGVDTSGVAVNVDITDGEDGTDVTLLAITDGVRVTGVDAAGDPVSVDVLDGEDVTLSTIANGVRVTGVDTSGTAVSVDIENGDNVNVEALPNGVRIIGLTVGGLPIQTDLTNGAQGPQGSITFRLYRDELFADPDPAPFTLIITDTGNFTVPAGWSNNGVPSTYDPDTDNLWIAEYEWDPAGGGATPTLIPILLTGPQGAGSGSSNVDGVVINGTNLAVDESGTPLTTNVVPIAQGTTNNDTLAGQGYVDDGLGDKEDTISATNRVDAEFVGTGVITNTEFNTLDGVTSNIQTQLDNRVDTTGDEDIAGVKTFTSTPKGANPADDSNDTSLATTNWVRGHIGTGGAGATNLGVDSRTNVSLDVTSSNGDDATVPQATTTLAGLLTGSDKDKLDTVARDADVTPSWVPATDPGYLTGVPTNLIDGQNLAAAQATLEINPDAEENVQADWLQGNNTQDDYIQNKPTALSAFTNDEQFIDLQEVPVRTATLVRGAMDNISISGGNLAIVLATRSVTSFTYGFTPPGVSQEDGSLQPFTIALTGLDANHTAEILSISPINGLTFDIDTAGTPPRQFFTVTPDEGIINAGFNQNIIPTVEATTIGTGVTETETSVTIPYQVTAPVAAPVQSNYFYYGVTNNVATSGDDIDDLVVLVDQISNSLDTDGNGLARTGGDYSVVRDRTDQGNKDITFTGQNAAGTLIEFIAVPASITPSFIELVDGHQYPAPFDADRIQGNAMINSVTYNIYKGVNDQGAEYIITF